MRAPHQIRRLLRRRARSDWTIHIDMVDVMLDLDPGMIGRELIDERRVLN